MDRKRGGTVFLVCSVVFACVCMGIVDAVIRPGYVPKSAVKLLLFLGLLGLYAAVSRDGSLKRVLRPDRKGLLLAAAAFALYHAAMMFGWFDAFVLALALAGLFAGGLIFNRFDERSGSIYLSWLVHMFANFATNTVGFLLFQS